MLTAGIKKQLHRSFPFNSEEELNPIKQQKKSTSWKETESTTWEEIYDHQTTEHWSKYVCRIFPGSVYYSEICNCSVCTSTCSGTDLFGEHGNPALFHLLLALFNVLWKLKSVPFGIYLRNSCQPLVFRKHLEAGLPSTDATLLNRVKINHVPCLYSQTQCE